MKSNFFPSILNDVIGPVMRGPSSSHTAASWRIAATGLQILDDKLESALIEMEKRSIWASNFREQGTALGMDGGLLGIDMTDERIVHAGQLAKEQGITIKYRISRFEADHTNTVRITLKGNSGRQVLLLAISTGGGMFGIIACDGHAVDIRGDSYHLVIRARPGFDTQSLHPDSGKLTGKYRVGTSVLDTETLIQLSSPEAFPEEDREKVSALEGVLAVSRLEPVLPVVSGNESEFRFTNVPSLMEFARGKGHSLGELGLMYESSRSGQDEEELKAKMKVLIGIVEGGIAKGLKGTRYTDRILHQQSDLVNRAALSGKIHSGSLVNRIIANVSALMEAKSAMEVIVAMPTAGSCGTFGGTIKAFCDSNGMDEEDKIMAYFAGGLVGVFFAMGPGFSAEEHGCQVETGAAGCMAAAALTELSGGNFRQALAAASMALQNTIGLICDPVADRVEVPCLGKNVTAGMNALAASTMALSGFDQVIPLDQVIHTVEKVGRALPSALCNSGKGGLSVTPKARELKKKLKDLDGDTLKIPKE
jgi:L-serine dehydratase